ncbi:MAG TPA: protein-glutamate O-methyltransferase CheR [Polyangiaceae bacterium]|nr:protein-glutamate O-methyltransferase CheR [Polyangiaceae bacterium]
MLDAGIRPLTEPEFRQFRELVEQQVGIHLSSVKQALVNARLLARIRELGLRTFGEYYDCVIKSPHDELIRFINAICTNETRFFREPNQFDYLRRSLIPYWQSEASMGRHPRRVRVWSAACSSGEEPYSVAMSLLSALPPEWSVEVLASDVSTKVLERALAAIYPLSRVSEIPSELQKPYLLRGVGSREGSFRIGPNVRAAVRFQRENLVTSDFSPLGSFDLIMCRNVLMYFKEETRREVVGKLVRRLVPNGHLFVGHSESLHGFNLGLETVAPAMYHLRGEREGSARGAA